MISLRPLDRRDADRVVNIAPRPDQERFAGTVAAALAEPETVDLHEICEGERAVGLFKIDRAYHLNHDFADPGDLGLRGVLLDAGVQGRGIGTGAMRCLPDYLPPRYPKAARVYLTVNFRNPAAIAVYRKAGFTDDGRVFLGGSAGPQHVMHLDLAR